MADPRNMNRNAAAAARQRQQQAVEQARRNAAQPQRQPMVINPNQVNSAQMPSQGQYQQPMPQQQIPQQQAQTAQATAPQKENGKKKRARSSLSLSDRLQTGRSASEMLDDAFAWIYDHSIVIFAVYGILFLLLGIFFNRYISFGGGLALVILGYAMSLRDSSKDTFLYYIVGLVIFAVPFMIV